MSTLHSVPQIINSLKITKSERHMDLLIKTTNTQTNPQMSFPSQQDLSANYYRAEGPTIPEPGIPQEEGRVLHPKLDSLGRLNLFISGGGICRGFSSPTQHSHRDLEGQQGTCGEQGELLLPLPSCQCLSEVEAWAL